MTPGTNTAPEQEAPQQLSWWGKTTLAVKSFVKGAVRALPMTLAYSAVAFTGSAILGAQFGEGYDFLKTGGATLSQLGVRMLGASVIGGTISGVVNSYKEVSAATSPEAPVPDATRPATGQRRGTQPQTHYDVSPNMTPVGQKFPERLGMQH